MTDAIEEPPLAPGVVVKDRYRIERPLGRGGMGIVLEATDTTLRRRVAIKVMTREYAADVELVRRFEREARAAARLRGEHAVRILDTGRLDEGAPFLVMELLRGQTLEEVLEREGPLPVERAVDVVCEALEAIDEAHACGLVHRDLKPSNLFLASMPNGSTVVKVLDFGAVKDVASGATLLTQTGDSMGTPAYMSPEQIRADEGIDARTDVWGIGATLYELLSGSMPFAAPSVPAVLARIIRDEPDPLRARRPEVPEALEAVIVRCLAKDKEARFGSVKELDEALRAVPRPAPGAARTIQTVRLPALAPPPPALGPAAVAAPAPVPAPVRSPAPASAPARPSGRGQLVVFVIATASVIIVGSLGILFFFAWTRKAELAPSAGPVPASAAVAPSSLAPPSLSAPSPSASAPPDEPASASDASTSSASSAPTSRAAPSASPPRLRFTFSNIVDGDAWIAAHRAAILRCASRESCGPRVAITWTADGVPNVRGTFFTEGSSDGRSSKCASSPAYVACISQVAAAAPLPSCATASCMPNATLAVDRP